MDSDLMFFDHRSDLPTKDISLYYFPCFRYRRYHISFLPAPQGGPADAVSPAGIAIDVLAEVERIAKTGESRRKFELSELENCCSIAADDLDIQPNPERPRRIDARIASRPQRISTFANEAARIRTATGGGSTPFTMYGRDLRQIGHVRRVPRISASAVEWYPVLQLQAATDRSRRDPVRVPIICEVGKPRAQTRRTGPGCSPSKPMVLLLPKLMRLITMHWRRSRGRNADALPNDSGPVQAPPGGASGRIAVSLVRAVFAAAVRFPILSPRERRCLIA